MVNKLTLLKIGDNMEELYVQKFGSRRIIKVIGWSDDSVLIYDLKDDLKYPMEWNAFFSHHEKLEPAEINVDDYKGSNLDLTDK